jgi:replicative DNA helicase
MSEQNSIPHSIEAEQAVLGALLRFNDCIDKLGDLQAKHFYREDHRTIYSQIVRLISQHEPADVITVYGALEQIGKAEEVGGLAYLNSMAQSTPSAANVGQYARVVSDRALLRGVMYVADSINALAQNPKGKNADEVLDSMQSLVSTLAERRVRNEPRMVREILHEVIEGIGKRAEGHQYAMPTGIEGIDRLLNGGARPGNLIIVAGRPSMGKTALTSDMGLNMAENLSVLNFSMEMEGREIASRALANRGRVALEKIMGEIPGNDDNAWSGVTTGTMKLNDLRFAIDDTAAISLLELRMKAKAWKRKHGLDVIIVDYIGLMTGGEGDTRSAQIGFFSRGLKALAKELGIAVICLAQLNRNVDGRSDHKPMLSDLRDSGEIEQDADVVMFVHRAEMYDPENEEIKGYAEVLVRKNRSGRLGDVPLKFDGAICRFSDWRGSVPTISSKGRSSRFDG